MYAPISTPIKPGVATAKPDGSRCDAGIPSSGGADGAIVAQSITNFPLHVNSKPAGEAARCAVL